MQANHMLAQGKMLPNSVRGLDSVS